MFSTFTGLHSRVATICSASNSRGGDFNSRMNRLSMSSGSLPSPPPNGAIAKPGTSPSSSTKAPAPNSTFPASKWPRRKVRSFRSLKADDFRHPLDQQNTAIMKVLPGMDMFAKSLLGPVAEQVLMLENISTSIQVSPEQLPSVHAVLREASEILHMDVPDLYIRQNPVPNAYTLAISGRKPFIVVHTSLLELLTLEELQAVLAHELAHLKCEHGVWLTIANILASGTVSFLPLVSGPVEEALMRWLRSAELTCDRAALLVAQDARVVVSALMKLAGGSPTYSHELNVDAFLRQARSYDEATSSPLGWYLRNAQTRGLSHPLPVLRAREIDRFSMSQQYRTLLERNQEEGAH